MVETSPTPLTGKALLQKVKELSNLPKRETAKHCGYYTSKNGQVRVNLTGFYDAVLTAKGVPLDPEGSRDGRGREPTYKVTVHKNGQIVIGSTYTKEMGLSEGDEFEIKLGYKHIHLIQIDRDKADS
jgi:AbrB family looped-hinge helix DNA binding protein